MGVQLVYANRTEDLLAALVTDLAAFRADAGPLSPARLVVPNRGIEEHVKLGIARAAGIAANIEATRLERFAADLVASHPDGIRLVDDRVIQGMTLSLLLDDAFLRELWAAPLGGYIFAAGDRDDVADLRRVQLSAQLAHLFEEYGYSRPDLLDQWTRRAVLQSTGQREVEAWQRHLWLHMFGRGGVLEQRAKKSGERWLDLRSFLRETSASELQLPRAVFAFGFSYFAPAFHQLFAWLAEAVDVRVYALNPCREYWEDAGRRDDSEDPFGLARPGENALLRQWGRPGREHVRLLNEATQCNFEERFTDPRGEAPTLLQRLQGDVLDRQGEGEREGEGATVMAAPRAPADASPRPPSAAPGEARPEGSAQQCPDLDTCGASSRSADAHIKVVGCPSIARETETVADEIWRLVREDPTLRFNDIAVIVTQREQDAYLTHLAAAFREAHELPYHVVDAPLSSQSRLVEGVGALLSLPLGGFGRQDLLGLITHPVVMERFPDVEPQEWLNAADDLGIVHGADREDHAQTYIRRDIFNWDQGLRRLALGAFMTGARSGDERTVDLGGRPYLPEEPALSSQSSAAQFGLLVRSLIADARFARGARMTLAQWSAFLAAYVTSYVEPADEQDERDLLRCLARIHDVDDIELGGVEVSYRVAYELVWSAISRMRGARGQGLGDGVVVSSFAPMRAIPFRVVFVTGLGEGLFPAAARRNHLDLRQAGRRPGDVNPRERDKYAFLETLLSARERLHLSYVARNELTGEALQPSSVVQELLHAVDSGYGGSAALRHQVALRRFDEQLPAIPEARREAQARALGDDLRAVLGVAGDAPDRHALRGMLEPQVWSQLSELLGIVDAPEPPPREAGAVETLEISISALRKFLECPLQGSARYLLRLHDDEDEDVLAQEDEPFDLSILDDIVFLREVFAVAEHTGKTIERAYAERAALRELQGRRPTALFGDVLRDRHMRDLAAWREIYAAIPHDATSAPAPYRFGRAEELAEVDSIRDPIAVELELADGRRARVRVSGRTSDIVPGDGGSLILAKRSQKSNGWFTKARNGRDWMRAFLDEVVLAAAGIKTRKPHGAYLCLASAGEPVAKFARFSGITGDEARAYLKTLVGDLLSGVHAYLLPFEAAYRMKVVYPNKHETAAEAVQHAVEQSIVSKYGPVPDIERFGAPNEDEAEAIIERRYAPMFERLEVPE